jgi:hypothetical protein
VCVASNFFNPRSARTNWALSQLWLYRPFRALDELRRRVFSTCYMQYHVKDVSPKVTSSSKPTRLVFTATANPHEEARRSKCAEHLCHAMEHVLQCVWEISVLFLPYIGVPCTTKSISEWIGNRWRGWSSTRHLTVAPLALRALKVHAVISLHTRCAFVEPSWTWVRQSRNS